ncbi:MAG: hypothetical protein K0R57_5654 [Paenibacillaceae bacterium]|nr:hypothetical protein [Paenibacillaceae bacterium]
MPPARACLKTRLRASFTAFSPLAALLSLDVPPVRLHKSALPDLLVHILGGGGEGRVKLYQPWTGYVEEIVKLYQSWTDYVEEIVKLYQSWTDYV